MIAPFNLETYTWGGVIRAMTLNIVKTIMFVNGVLDGIQKSIDLIELRTDRV